jgi:ERCC4-related helicase
MMHFMRNITNQKHQYLVLNYDKFSQPYTQERIYDLVQEKIDFVVLDEIQFIKKRSDSLGEEESQRRKNLGGLLTEARKLNRNLKALDLSATPVINHLSEGISLLSYITGNEYNDLSDKSTTMNAMALHQKLTLLSIREMPRYKSEVREHFINVFADRPKDIHMRFREFVKNPLLIEQYLTKARIPEIIRCIDNKQTIIYTEYVTGIIEMIAQAVKDEGYSYALYIGQSHEEHDLQRFKNEQAKVLIASKPVSVGVDGLQKSCNNLIINTLPWTNA